MPNKVVRKTSAPRTSKKIGITHETIARRAYERFIERGMQHGMDLEDWLAAERELNIRQ
jgi:hypothetical protein